MSDLDIVWHFARLREVFNITDQWVLITHKHQANRSLSTVSLECFLQCLSRLASALQYSHNHWILYIDRFLNKAYRPLSCISPRIILRCIGQWLARWKCANLFYTTFLFFVWSSFMIRPVTSAEINTYLKINISFLKAYSFCWSDWLSHLANALQALMAIPWFDTGDRKAK